MSQATADGTGATGQAVQATEIVEVRSDAAPEPVGPYSQAVALDGIVYASGQIPLDPSTGTLVAGEIETQARQVIANLAAVLESAGSGLEHVLRTTVYLIDLSLFPRVNAIYAEAFTGRPAPARATVQVAGLPLGAQIEIDLIARIPCPRPVRSRERAGAG